MTIIPDHNHQAVPQQSDHAATGEHVSEQHAIDHSVVDEYSAKKNSNKLKKPWIILTSVVVLLLLIGGVGYSAWKVTTKPAPTPTPTPQKKRVVEPANVIPVEERPVVYLSPAADGRRITLAVQSLNKPADTVEYDIEYQSGELIQGMSGDLSVLNLPASTEQLLGTCSAGGKCSYHENVVGGKVQLRFIGPENYLVSQEWRYTDNTKGSNEAGSRDAKFQISGDSLTSARFIIVYNSPGFPNNPPGIVASDIYSFQTSSPVKGEGMVMIRANQDGANAIAGWNGAEWQVFAAQVDGKQVSAEVPFLPLYVAITQ